MPPAGFPRPGPSARAPRRLLPAGTPALVVYMAASAGLGYLQGQDVNWDLRNYHFYAPYLWLDDRFARDVLPAGVQTFLNPLLDIPFFLAVRAGVSPLAIGTTLALVHGVALWLVHRIAAALVAGHPAWFRAAIGVVAAATAAYGSAFLGEVGTTFGDTVIAATVIGAVALLLAGTGGDRLVHRSLAAGLVLGLGLGAKQTAMAYIPGLALLACLTADSWGTRVRALAALGAAGAAGLLITGGWWMWGLYTRFGNPVLPWYNHIARSPWGPPLDLAGLLYGDRLPQRHVPFSLPFRIALDVQTLSAEVPFRDARLAVGLLSALLVLAWALVWWRRRQQGAWSLETRRLVMLAAFYVTSYAVWTRTAMLYRFAMSLELLSLALAAGLLARVIANRRAALSLAAALGLALALWTEPLHLGRIPWQPDYFGLAAADFEQFHDATVVLADLPSAYIVPIFPQSTGFVRFTYSAPMGELWRMRWTGQLRRTPPGRLFILQRLGWEHTPAAAQTLESLGYSVDAEGCRLFTGHIEAIQVCPVAMR